MSYLRKKLQAIMASADFKGYLREVTGTDSVTLTDCMGSDMTSLSLVGNAVQDGTPSPDNPVEIQGCGDRTANLFDVSRHTGFDGNSITITNTSGANWQGQAFNIDYAVEFGKTYTYSVDYVIDNVADYSTIRLGYITASAGSVIAIGDIITIHGSGMFVHTVTVPESIDDFDYFVLYANSSGGNPAVGDKITISNIQIVEGSYTAETMPPYEPYGYKIPVEVSGNGDTQTFNIYTDKPLYGLKHATGATGYYTYQDDNGNKYLCDTIAIDFDKHTAKRTDNLKYRSLADVAAWSEYTNILYDDVYHMYTINVTNPGQDIKTYYTDTDGTNKSWIVDSIVSNVMPTDSTYPVNTTPTVCTGSTPSDFANCIRYWFLKTDVDAYTGDTVRDRVAAYWEDFCADRDVMALYITNPSTTDISAMQDWDTIPKLWRGTAIATVKTTVPTKAITARYYATKKED